VEHEVCDACGFNGARYDDAALLVSLRSLGPSWRALLAASGEHLRTRPRPEVWSALEYAAHSRDITALHAFGVEQALTIDEPSIPAIDNDLVDSVADTYAAEDVDDVVDALETQADRLARLAESAGPGNWSRGFTIGDERVEVRRLLQHALHDAVHHLDDVERGLASL
jgi:hypothetical protein